MEEELRHPRKNLRDSQVQLETYRTQLETVNQQLAALKGQQSVDDRMGKLLADNKDLTDKLTAARKELADIKANPKSKLAMVETQLKNLQDQYDASQEANKALQDTTTTLKEQLDQAQADLVAANQKLAAASAESPEYATIKHENEIMRGILTREMQEQAHRDMAKRLYQEEFDNLKIKSKVLQEQLDILASPMTPADQRRGTGAAGEPQGAEPGCRQRARVQRHGIFRPGERHAVVARYEYGFRDGSGSLRQRYQYGFRDASRHQQRGRERPPATDNTTNQPPVTIVMNNQAPATYRR